MRRLLLPIAVLALVASACSVALGDKSSSDTADTLSTPSSSPLPAGKEPVANVVARVLPAVVNVTTDVFQPTNEVSGQQAQGVGTGFIVRSDGVIVTNCHVVERASKITVSTSADNPAQYQARVIGGDCEHDLAVLKIDATDLPTVSLGDSDSLRLGQRVIALGYALALEGGPTVTSGIVSSLDRTIQAQDPGCDPDTCPNGSRTYADVIQTDAAINHGNSGGPLVNMQGQVVGINTAGDDSAENIGFAIAINSAKDTIEQGENDPLGAVGYLGVITRSVTSDLAVQFGLPVDSGAYVLDAANGTPAANAGIRQGDVIVALDGQTIGSSEDLGSVLDGLKPGTTVDVDLVGSDGAHRTVSVTLGRRPLPNELP